MVVTLDLISLKRSDRLRERWVQDQIVNDPLILGLGQCRTIDHSQTEGESPC